MNSLSSSTQVTEIDANSAERAYATLVVAFATDPAARWSWPDADSFLRNMPRLARAFGGKSFSLGSAHEIAGFAGVALWLPPGITPDEAALDQLMQETVAPAIQKEADEVFGQMASFHPKEPHWYLPLIGVDPARQGQRLGDHLMAHALARCDAEATLAYLESSNPKNLSFYRWHGFEPLGSIQYGSSPTLIPMLRKPHAPSKR